MSTVHLFDVDATLRPGGPVPHPPKAEVGAMFRQMQRQGSLLGLCTGRCEVEAMGIECQLGVDPLPFLGVDYGAVLISRGRLRPKRVLTPRYEHRAMMAVARPLRYALAKYIREWSANQAIVTAFAHPERFDDARRVINALLAEQGDATAGYLATVFNAHDQGVSVVPRTVQQRGKGLAAQALQRRGFKIGVAAGDGLPDLPMLRQAEFPIVTFDEGNAPRPELVALVAERGVGHVATQADGMGLVEGLEKAREAGVIRF